MARLSALDALLASSDQQDEEAASTAARLKSAASFRSPEVNARIKARETAAQAIASGEDPRITTYYTRLAHLSDASLPKEYADRKKASFTAKFIAQNPDLDPRTPAPPDSAAIKANDALDKAVGDMVRMATSGSEPSRQAAGEAYSKLKDQITPELREKYSLDQFEQKGLLKKEGKGAARTILGKAGAGAQRFAATTAAIGEQGMLGLKQAVGRGTEADKKKQTWGAFKADIDSGIGFGEVYRRAAEGVAGGPGKRATLLGMDLGGQTNSEGHFEFDPTKTNKGFGNFKHPIDAIQDMNPGLVAAQLIGFGGDVGTDPLNYVGAVGENAKLAEAGKKFLEAKNLGNIYEKIHLAGGVKGLTVTEHAAARQAVVDGLEDISKLVTKSGSKEAAADKVMGGLEAQGQRGLKFGGRTIIPVPAGPANRAAANEAARLAVADTLKASEVGRGAVLKDAGEAVVHQWDESARSGIIEPKDRLTVLRGTDEHIVDVDQVKVGDKILDGKATVHKVDADTNRLTVEVDKGVDEFKVIPKHEADAIANENTAAKGRSIMAQDKLEAATRYDRLGAARELDDEIIRTEADNTLSVEDRAAKLADLNKQRDALPGQRRAARARERIAEGGPKKGLGSKVDIRRPHYKPDFHPSLSSAVEPENFNVAVQTGSGWQTGRRLFKMRNTKHMVNEGWDLIAPRIDSAGQIIEDADPIKLAKVVGWNETPDGVRLVINPTVADNVDLMAKQIGDEIPEFAAVVTGRSGGQLELRAMTQAEYDAAKAAGPPAGLATRGAEKPAAALEGTSALGGTPEASAAKGAGRATAQEVYEPQAKRTMRKKSIRDQVLRGSKEESKRGMMADALSPRARAEAGERLGAIDPGQAGVIASVQAGERAAIGNTATDLARRNRSVTKRLVKDLGRKDAQAAMSEAFDVERGAGSRAEEVAQRLADGGKDKAASAIRTMADIRQEVSEIGLTAEEIARAIPPSQLPLITTHEGAEILKGGGEPQLALSVLGVDHAVSSVPGFDWTTKLNGASLVNIDSPEIVQHLRSLPELPNALKMTDKGAFLDMTRPVHELDDAFNTLITDNAKIKLGLRPNEKVKFFHDSAVTVYAIRSQAAHRIAIEAETTMRLADEGILHIVTTDAGRIAAAGDGLVEVEGLRSPLGRAYARPEVAPELNRMAAITRNSEQLKQFKRTVDHTTALWTRQVLSPLTKGLAYPLRNAMSNNINAVFGGLTVAGQREANNIQMTVIRGANKLMEKEGLSFESALARMTENDARAATLVKYLRDDNIMNTGMYRSLATLDAAGDIERAGVKGAKGFAKRNLSPLSPDMVLFRPGRAINTVIEDNARIALYISVFDKTGSRAAAREAVAKYLFDYADLTPFESTTLKSINAFWTFTRKNTALQVKLLADRPQLAMNTMRLKESLFDQSPEGSSLLYPNEAKEGKGVAGPFLQNVMGGKGVVNIDDPVTSAMQALDPIIMTAYAGISTMPGGKRFVENLPPSEQPTSQNITRGVLKNTAGAPAALATFLFENATGVDVRSGRPLDTTKTRERFINTITPVYGQADTLASAFGAGDDTKIRTNILRLTTGISFYRRDNDVAKRSLILAMTRELELTIDQAKAAGIDTPTLQELQTAGIVPTATEMNKLHPKPRKIELTPEQKKEAARQSITRKAG